MMEQIKELSKRKHYSDPDKTLRLISCDIIEIVLPIFEKAHGNDDRLRISIDTSRKYANGLAKESEIIQCGKKCSDASWDYAMYYDECNPVEDIVNAVESAIVDPLAWLVAQYVIDIDKKHYKAILDIFNKYRIEEQT